MSQPISALYFGHSQSERRIGLDLSAGPGFTVCEHRSGPSLTECTEGNSVTRLMAPLIRAIFTPPSSPPIVTKTHHLLNMHNVSNRQQQTRAVTHTMPVSI